MITVLAALAGWCAIPVAVMRYQVPGLRPLLACNALAGLLIAVHYGLSGLFSGAAIAATAAVAALLQLCLARLLAMRWRIMIALPAIATCLWLSASGLASWAGLLPVLAFSIGRIAETQKDDFRARVMFLFATGTWIVYLLIEWSPPGLTFEVIGLTSNLVGLARFHADRIKGLLTR